MSLIQNKRAYYDFEIEEEYEAGIKLYGYEVKSLREKKGSLKGSYIIIRNGEVFLKGAYIPPYQKKNAPDDYDPEQTRKLLLNKQEIKELAEAEGQTRLTIIPISIYNKDGKIKLKIAIAKGKRKYDKRREIKEKEEKRRMDRELKYNQ